MSNDQDYLGPRPGKYRLKSDHSVKCEVHEVGGS